MNPRLPRAALHPYQVDAIEDPCQATDRQVIAIMGAGKTTIALHAIADLKASTALSGPVLVAAPLMIADSVWHTEAARWEATAGLRVERVIGSEKKRIAALARPADIYVSNFDILHWLLPLVVEQDLHFALIVVDEASALKSPAARRTRMAMQLGLHADRRWALTGTPRSYQLLDVWGPANFVTRNGAFPPFLSWRGAHFYPADIYGRIWKPKPGVEDAIIARLRDFTMVVDRAALATRPPVVEIHHQVPLPQDAAAAYSAMDNGTTADFAKLMTQGITPPADIAVVGKLMQVLSGAIYSDDDDDGERTWKVLHARRLDVLADIHEGHSRPTLVFVSFRHEIARIRERFPFARELHADLIEPWNRGEIEMLVAHPASAGHGVNLQYGSDTLVWFSLPWSAELFTQAIARLVRQGQRDTVNIHIMTSPGRIDELALATVRQRLVDQDAFITGLEAKKGQAASPRPHSIPKLRREIGSEVYDTETASVLHHDRHDHDGMSFAYGSVLMITVSDRYFVVYYNETGAPDSAWLRPVTVQEAVHWAGLHCNWLVHEIFGYTPAVPRGPVLKEWLRKQKSNDTNKGNKP